MIALIIGVAFCAVCIGVVVSTSKELRLRRQLSQSGLVAEAQIVNHKKSYRVGDGVRKEKGEWKKRPSSYFVTYTFSVTAPDGPLQQYTREEQVSVNLYDLPIGSTVRIWYRSQDPNGSRLIDNRYGNKALLIMMIPMLALGLFLFFATIRFIWRNSRMERYGQLLTGEIVSCERAGKGGVTFRYRFYSPVGNEVHGRQVAFRNLANLPPSGTKAAVLYVGDRTHRLL